MTMRVEDPIGNKRLQLTLEQLLIRIENLPVAVHKRDYEAWRTAAFANAGCISAFEPESDSASASAIPDAVTLASRTRNSKFDSLISEDVPAMLTAAIARPSP